MSACRGEGDKPAEGPGLPRVRGPFRKFPGPRHAGLGAHPLRHPGVPCEGNGDAEATCWQSLLFPLLLLPGGEARGGLGFLITWVWVLRTDFAPC